MLKTRQHERIYTKTVRLKKEQLNVRYAELGDPAKPPVLLPTVSEGQGGRGERYGLDQGGLDALGPSAG